MTQDSQGKLYVVGTPIGNLGDMTVRAVETLKNADFIACEDTRTSGILLRHFNILTQRVSCHKFNEHAVCETLIKRIKSGEDCALISDAGTPCVSDPGAFFVEKAAAAGIEIIAIPGACAAASSVSISGFDGPFAFYGFLPRDGVKQALEKMKDGPELAVFYESPNRIISTLRTVREVYPESAMAVCNDLTKKFERVYRGSITEVLGQLLDNEDYKKGEYTIAVKMNRKPNAEPDEITVEARLVNTMVREGLDIRDAMELLVKRNEAARNEVYKASLRLKGMFNEEEFEDD